MEAFRTKIRDTLSKGEHESALKMATENLESAKQEGDKNKKAHALLTLAETQIYLGLATDALHLLKDTKTTFQDDAKGEAKCLILQVHAQLKLGNYQEAMKMATKALGMFQKEKDREGEAEALHMLASARTAAKQRDAKEPMQKALSLYRELGDRKHEAAMMVNIAEMQLSESPDEAIKTAHDAGRLYGDISNAEGEIEAVHVVVKAHIAMDDKQDALEAVKDKLAEFKGSKNQKGEFLVYPLLFSTYIEIGEVDEAFSIAQEALDKARDNGDQKQEAHMLNGLAEVHAARDELEKAVEVANDALEIFREIKDMIGIGSVESTLTALYTMKKEAHKAPHRAFGIELLGKLVQAVIDKNAQAFDDVFAQMHSTLGVDQTDIDGVMKPIFQKDPNAERFFKERAYAHYGWEEPPDAKPHTRKACCIDRIVMFAGQRWGSMGYGPSFRSVQATHRVGDPWYPNSDTCAMSVIKDNTLEVWEAAAQYQAHPGVMDAALQVQGVPHWNTGPLGY